MESVLSVVLTVLSLQIGIHGKFHHKISKVIQTIFFALTKVNVQGKS